MIKDCIDPRGEEVVYHVYVSFSIHQLNKAQNDYKSHQTKQLTLDYTKVADEAKGFSNAK